METVIVSDSDSKRRAIGWLFGDPGPRFVLLALTVLTFIMLSPYANKAFTIDDTLFLKVASQITNNPGNPYGFKVNWYGTEMDMFDVTKNPPLASYYQALVAVVSDWSEYAMHFAFIPFAVLVVIGTYLLARGRTPAPVMAALAVLLAPTFLVSSTSIMCDTMMLAMFVWAVLFWVEGIDRNSRTYLAVAALIAGLAILTKYFAISLLPLMVVYAILKRCPTRTWLVFLPITIGMISVYEYWSYHAYGKGLLGEAIFYSQEYRNTMGSEAWARGLVGLGFATAAAPMFLFSIPVVWSRRAIVVFFFTGSIIAWTITWGIVPTGTNPITSAYRLMIAIELGLLAAGGVAILGLTARNLWRSRDTFTLFLALWIIGTFIFGTVFNWTVNARSIMPLGPPAAIILSRHLIPSSSGRPNIILWAILFCITAALGHSVAWGDYALAASSRKATMQVAAIPRNAGTNIWFQGHWGFQYYMEAAGGHAMDLKRVNFENEDLLIIPENNSNVIGVPARFIGAAQMIELPASSWITTMQKELGAGFYSTIWGPLPFVFGPVPSEKYYIVRLKKPWTALFMRTQQN